MDRKHNTIFAKKIQLAPALTDFRGPSKFICYKRTSVTANIKNEIELVEETKNYYLLQAENSAGSGLLAQGSTVLRIDTNL